ncbi:MAG: PIG-L family deacetylase [Opitutaceae bacterium]|nr:PIG-L family deacetylase [Opitutaceae bacterium]MBP9912497.1 PIG-L family deacetylase [Opitutaceae bacterium]
MKFSRPEADVFVPAGGDADTALARTTHLCVIAHQDDIEINAYPAVAECYDRTDRFFTGVVVTNGAGSPRSGVFANHTDEQMKRVRIEEQRTAARLGKYNLQLQLAHPSVDVKKSGHVGVQSDLRAIFSACRPQTVYLHQPLDKHDTHVAVLLRSLEAIRSLPKAHRPARVLGVEAWRGLDWLMDDEKVAMDCSAHPELALKLIQVFASQVVGGKRYDTASLGRRQANATFHSSHSTDKFTEVAWAVDLTPLVADDTLSVEAFTLARIEKLRADVAARLKNLL